MSTSTQSEIKNSELKNAEHLEFLKMKAYSKEIAQKINENFYYEPYYSGSTVNKKEIEEYNGEIFGIEHNNNVYLVGYYNTKHFEYGRIVLGVMNDTEEDPLFEKELNVTPKTFEKHNNIFPNLQIDIIKDDIGSVVKLKSGKFVTIDSAKNIIE